MINRKGIIAGVLMTSIFFSSFSVLADNPIDKINNEMRILQKELENQRGDMDKVRKLMGNVESEIEELEIVIEKYDFEREKLKDQLDGNQKEIDELDLKIEGLNKDIEVFEEDLEGKKNLFTKQVRYLYTRGLTGQLEALFSADTFESFMSYFTFSRKLNKRNDELMKAINKNIKDTQKSKEDIEFSKDKVEVLKADTLKKLAKNEEQIRLQEIANSELKDKINEYRETLRKHNITISNTQRAIQEGKSEIERIKLIAEQKKNAQNNNSGGGSGVSGEEIIAMASEFLGQPYLWGGTKPYDGNWWTGFDCSGLVQYCYKKYGIVTGRTTYDQIDHPNGQYVARKDLKPGDLVFFGTKSNPHHVGLYIGNNKYLHAPKTGDVIKISSMTRRDYLEGRRFIKN